MTDESDTEEDNSPGPQPHCGRRRYQERRDSDRDNGGGQQNPPPGVIGYGGIPQRGWSRRPYITNTTNYNGQVGDQLDPDL